MSLPYFPMFPSDFEAKTSHLSLIEDGAYNRLLRICWMTPGCSMPADEAWIMRRARAHGDAEQAAVRAVLEEFFAVVNGRYSNARLRREWLSANDAHEKRKNAGAKGGKAKALKYNDSASSNAVAMPKQPEPEPESRKREANASPKKSHGTRLPDDWTLPKAWGEWALSQQWPEPVVRAEADKFRDYWHSVAGQKGRKADWQATWRNWMRNSKQPKVYEGRRHEPASKSQDRLSAFIAGARGAS